MTAKSMSAFLCDNMEGVENKEIIVTKRAKDEKGNPVPWEIKALDAGTIKRLRKASTKFINGTLDIDTEVLNAKLACESVVFPDLKDEGLQKSYGVMGEEALLNKMLLPGEYDNLIAQVMGVNGYNADELVNEAKN
jgi:hypothetical protein